jgi:nucleotide-binding universal stress UspA family protein
LIVPYIQKSPAKFDRIVCCWDGSAPAARAIADAMPFLHKAKKIDLLMVTTAKTRNLTIVGTNMAQHLARHGLNVEIQQIKGADTDVAGVVLSYAADNETDFLVMGGYGHSRWRELVLGGATRGILSSMTTPTLMSH